MEIWKDIVGYEGLYQVSNHGNVKSFRKFKRVLKCATTPDGYSRVCFQVNGSNKNYFVQRLVAEAFMTNPNKYPQINHIDGNKKNNHVSNLEWCTNSHNQRHAIRTGLRRRTSEKQKRAASIQGKKMGKKVLHFDMDGKKVAEYNSAREAAKRTGFNWPSIARCCRGERTSLYKTHVFRYA